MPKPLVAADFHRIRNYIKENPDHPLDADIQERVLEYLAKTMRYGEEPAPAVDVFLHSLKRLPLVARLESGAALHEKMATISHADLGKPHLRNQLGVAIEEAGLHRLDDLSDKTKSLCITALCEMVNTVDGLCALIQHLPYFLEHGRFMAESSAVTSKIVRLVFDQEATDAWRAAVNRRYVSLLDFGPANMQAIDPRARQALYQWDPEGWLDRLLKEGIPDEFRETALTEWALVAPPKLLIARAADWVKTNKQLVGLLKNMYSRADSPQKSALLKIFLKRRKPGKQLKTLAEIYDKNIDSPKAEEIFWLGLPAEDALFILGGVSWITGNAKAAWEKTPDLVPGWFGTNPNTPEARMGLARLLKSFPENLTQQAEKIAGWDWPDLDRAADLLGGFMAQPAGIPILRAYLEKGVDNTNFARVFDVSKFFKHIRGYEVSPEQLRRAAAEDPGALAFLLDDVSGRYTDNHAGTPYTPLIKYLCACSDSLAGTRSLEAYCAARQADPENTAAQALREVLLDGAIVEMDAMRMLSEDLSRDDILGLWRTQMRATASPRFALPW